MPRHCQVMVHDEFGKTYSYPDGNGRMIAEVEPKFCLNKATYQCSSGFKFCREHKKTHGDKGNPHSFRRINNGVHKPKAGEHHD